MPVTLHAHQIEALEKMRNGCILYGGVGVGKTITSLAYYYTKVCGGELNKWASMTSPKDVYVITTAKVRDSQAFELQAGKMGVHGLPALSTNGVKITVDSWNNLHKYTEVKDAFFIFDEQRVVGYGSWARAFIKVAKSNEWILLSATPGDTWLDYIPVFIANGFYRNKTDFIDQHVIWTPRVKYPKVLRYQNVGVLVKHRNQVLVHMPLERHTKRHPIDVVCGYDHDKFERVVKKKWHVFENRPLRDPAELFSVMRKVVNSDSSRLAAVEKLMSQHPRLIVFYNFDYELEMLRTLSPSVQQPPSKNSLSEFDSSVNEQERLRTLSSKSDFRPSTNSSPALSVVPTRKTSPHEKSSNLSSAQSLTNSGSGSKSTSSGTTLVAPELPTSPEFSTSAPAASTTPATSSSSSITPSDVSAKSASNFAIAEWNGHKHEDIPTTERWLYLVQYRAGAEGWNCIDTDAIVFYSQTYSYRDWWQAHGRIDRINTKFVDLYYYYFISDSIIDKAIKKALKTKKNFNEKNLKLPTAA